MDFVKLLNTLDGIQAKKTLTESAVKAEDKVDEEKTEEGNEFSGELAKAKAAGKKEFEVDGKKYPVKESADNDADDDNDDEDDKETVEESQLEEKAAPGQEDWIKSNKERFINQYGKKKGLEVLYATAWKRSKKNESMAQLEECYDMAMQQPEQESGMSINASTDTRTGSKSLTVTAQGQAAEQLAQLLKLSGIGSSHTSSDMEMEEAAYVNTPEPETQGVEVQLAQGNDLNRPKNSYPKVAGGDNPMNMREAQELAEIEQRLNEELAAFKVVAEGVADEKDIINSGMPLKYIEQQLQQSGLEKDIRYFIRWAIDNGSSHIEDAIKLGDKAQSQNPEISYGLNRLKKYVGQGVAEGSEPKLGTVKANLMNTQQPTVQVQVYKHNTLRGDSYWVTKEVKKFKTMDQAQAYVDRINKQGVAEAKGKKPDFLDMDKDGDRKEPMKKALADKAKKSPPKAK